MNALAVGTVVAASSVGSGDSELSGSASANAGAGAGGLILDPVEKEASEAKARVTVGTMPALDMVTDIWMTGEAGVDTVIRVSAF